MTTVLVIDNDALSLGLTVQLLKIGGFEVLRAEDVEQAIVLATQRPPDVILMNIGSGVDGLADLGRVRAASVARHSKIVATTPYPMDVEREALLAAGFDEHIRKPMSMDALNSVIRAVGFAQ